MMAFGEDADLSERLLVDTAKPSTEEPHNGDANDEEYAFISKRETLVFEDALSPTRYGQGGGGTSFLQAYLFDKIQPGSVKGSMFTMTVAIVGAGVLALPYAVEQSGLLLGLILILALALVTNFSLRLLLACAELAQARSYMHLASATGGRKLANFTQLVVCMNLFGTSVGYLVGSAELGQLVVKSFIGSETHSVLINRQALILLLCIVFILPLSLFRSLESLRFTSLFSIVCVTFMSLVIMIKYFQFVHLGYAPDIAYQLHHLVLFDWQLHRLLKSIPLVIFVYTCHPNVLPIYLVLKRRSSKRMYKVMNRSVGIAATVYCVCSGFVVLTFGAQTRSNFFENDYHRDGAVVVGCIGFSIALVLAVPLFVHTLRDNIREALMKNRQLGFAAHTALTLALVASVLLVSLGSGNIASVLGLLGATTNPLICFILPAFFIYRLGPKELRLQKVLAVSLASVTLVTRNCARGPEESMSARGGSGSGSRHQTTALVQLLGEFALFLEREKRSRSQRRRRAGKKSPEEAAASARKRAVLEWFRALSPLERASLCCVVDVSFVKTLLLMAIQQQARHKAGRYRTAAGVVQRSVPEFQLVDWPTRVTTKRTQPKEFIHRPVVRTNDGDVFSAFHSHAFAECSAQLLQCVRILNSHQSCDTLGLSMSCFEPQQEGSFLKMMETISNGQFLCACPSESTLQQRVWGETKWLAAQGYYSIAALIVNQIELNIWYHWEERTKAPVAFKVPFLGMATKHNLVQEWRLASKQQQYESLAMISVKAMAYLKGLLDKARTASPRAMQSALGGLGEIIEVYCEPKALTESVLIDECFSASFQATFEKPQAAAMKLLLAEHLQEQCSVLLGERLLREDESELILESSVSEQKSSNHTQRRRANRKKMLKQRRQENDLRLTQQRLLKAVLIELKARVKAMQIESLKVVNDTLNKMIEDSMTLSTLRSNYSSGDSKASTKKKKKRKKAKKPDVKPVAYIDNQENAGNNKLAPELQSADTSASRDILKDSDGIQATQESTPERRPLFSFLSASEKGYNSPSLPARQFRAPAFYSSTSPFFLSLTPPDSSEEDQDCDQVVNTEQTVDPCPEWFLPSLFSSQSSIHTTSTASSLDWDFHHWQFKSDNYSASRNMTAAASSSTTIATPSQMQLIPAAAKPYSLDSFANIYEMDRGNHQEMPDDDDNEDPVPILQDDLESSSQPLKSDFLYRQGGFFDRQRSLKRRRRPISFDNHDETNESNVDDGCEDCSHCCKCACHKQNSRECACSQDASTNGEQENNREFNGAGSVGESSDTSTTSIALDRITKLEAGLKEQSKIMTELSTAYKSEMAALQETVSMLASKLHLTENRLRELPDAQERMHENGANTEQEGAMESSASFTDSGAQHQGSNNSASREYDYSPPAMTPVTETDSVLGPFVSVPMSVLPPRSKLHWDMCEFVSQLQTDSNARLPAQMAAQRLCTATVQSLWPRAQVRPYGSFVTRLVLPSSDLDLVICLPKVRRDAPADAAGVLEGRNAIKETWQQNLARKLRQEPWVVPDSVKTIPHAAIPIITLITTPPYNVRLDISFEGPGHNGLATNDVVLSLIHEFPPLAPIMLVLKSFAIDRGFAISYSGGLSSYALLLMVARYLQEHSDAMSSGFEHASAAVQHSITAQSCSDFGMMLMGFLDFYGNRFDPRTTGISVATRCFLNREHTFATPAKDSPRNHQQYYIDDTAISDGRHTMMQHGHWQMPQQSPGQTANLLSSPGSRRYGNRSSHGVDQTHDPHKFDPVFIEDPLQPSNNVGRNCFRIMQIRRAFSAAYSTLMGASMSRTVFHENRNTLINGIALHPDNSLRALLGPHAPVHAKSETSGSSTSYHPGGAMMGGPYRYNNHVANYGNESSAATSSYPFQQQQQQQQQHQHQLNNMKQRAFTKLTGSVKRPTVHRSDSSSALSSPSYRRYSESVSETMTTRSDVASPEKVYHDRRKEFFMASRAAQSSNLARGEEAASDDTSVPMRKGSGRSLSFADVVVGGAPSSLKQDIKWKEPTSPLTRLRPARMWEDAVSEKWETKDDSQLK